MAMNTMAPASATTTISHALSKTEICTNFHDASFSSYISNSKSTSLPNHVDLKDMPTLHSYQMSTQRITADREISIFDAEKYFNGGLDKDNGKITKVHEGENQIMEDKSVDLQSEKRNFNPGFKSSCSERSWNSRSTLLPGVPNEHSPNQKNKTSGKRILSTFSWMCSCYKIEETVGRSKSSGKDRETCMRPISSKKFANANPVLQREENFVFTVSSSAVPNLKAGKHYDEESEGRSPTLLKGDEAGSLDRRLAMFAWHVNGRGKAVPAIPGSRILQEEEGSDCSSDLFEINNLSENVHPFFKHQESDGMSTSAATFYEPSEASIDWSVVTASALNVPTAISSTNDITKTTYAKGMAAKKGHSNRIFGCKTQEAAKVAEEEHRIPKKTDTNTQRRHKTVTLTMPDS